MRCHNLAGAAATGLKNGWNYLTAQRGCSPNLMSLILSLVLLLTLTVSFYCRILRRGPVSPGSTKKPALQVLPALNRFPYEPFIFLIYASSSWLSHAGLSVLRAFLDTETRAKMWEGMDILGGVHHETVFWIIYFTLLEGSELYITRRLVLVKYMAEKKRMASLPITEEKEVLREPSDEKEVSIYEVIAEPPPTESESLLKDTESNTVIPPRPSLWQRFKSRCTRRAPALTAESVLGRFYMMAFFKCNLIFSFAMLANRTACSLSPEQYFDGKAGQFPVLLAGCVLWTISSGRLLIHGMRFARSELNERRSVAL